MTKYEANLAYYWQQTGSMKGQDEKSAKKTIPKKLSKFFVFFFKLYGVQGKIRTVKGKASIS